MKGIFITIEGNDGSGKSTIINGIKAEFARRKLDVLFSREPGGSTIAEKIREIILDPNNDKMDDRTEALLYAASRRQHLVETIIPALEEGKIVICDRYIDSSLAYQGYARGIGIDEVYHMNMFATSGLLPDLTIYLLVKPEVGLSRKSKQKELDRLEKENNSFHHQVYDGYLELIPKFKDRVKVVNGEGSIESVTAEVLKVIDDYINKCVK